MNATPPTEPQAPRYQSRLQRLNGMLVRLPWLALGVEVFSIVFALLLGQWANGRFQEAERREQAAELLRAIRLELAANQQELARVAPYHSMMLDSTRYVLSTIERGAPEYPRFYRGLQAPVLRRSAFASASNQPAFTAVDAIVQQTLYETYSQQQRYEEVCHAAADALLQRDLEQYRTWMRFLYYYASTVSYYAPGLDSTYTRTFSQIDAVGARNRAALTR